MVLGSGEWFRSMFDLLFEACLILIVIIIIIIIIIIISQQIPLPSSSIKIIKFSELYQILPITITLQRFKPAKTRQDARIGGSERQHTLPVEDNYGFEPHGSNFFAFCSLFMTIDRKHLRESCKIYYIYLFYLIIADYIIYLYSYYYSITSYMLFL